MVRRHPLQNVPETYFTLLDQKGCLEAAGLALVDYGFPENGFTMRTPSISFPCCMSSEKRLLQPDCLAVCTTKASQKEKPCRRWRSIAARMSPRSGATT